MWLEKIASIPGRLLVKILTRKSREYVPFSVHDTATLSAIIQPCDVLLVEGDQWISGAIKYLTQSTWSHSALYVGNIIDPQENPDDPKVMIEADIKLGVIAVPLSKYQDYNVRICRPVGLTPEDKSRVVSYMMRNLGAAYDMKNVVDLARYLFPTPPVPGWYRRRMLSLGSGDPTRAICSSLIAQAFQSVKFPILPRTLPPDETNARVMHEIRHHSLFVPRDFDLSPYFRVVKPSIEDGFDYREIQWLERTAEPEQTLTKASANPEESPAS
jgi:hypothetical protein